jgi:hypothetical protein
LPSMIAFPTQRKRILCPERPGGPPIYRMPLSFISVIVIFYLDYGRGSFHIHSFYGEVKK